MRACIFLTREQLTAGEGILKDLLKAQKLEDGQVHRRMESQPAFIGPKGAIELYSVSAVYLDFSFVVLPRDSELNDALWDCRDLESLLILRMLLKKRALLKSRYQLYNSNESLQDSYSIYA